MNEEIKHELTEKEIKALVAVGAGLATWEIEDHCSINEECILQVAALYGKIYKDKFPLWYLLDIARDIAECDITVKGNKVKIIRKAIIEFTGEDENASPR